MVSKRYIGIAGTIAAGKSTFAKELGDVLDIPVIKEPISPYLADFYADNKEYAFRMQVYMMTSRTKGSLILSKFGGIQDRTIFEDRIFQKMLYDRGDMDKRDFDTCTLLYNSLSKPEPDLIIYLKVSAETSIKRQKERAREKETGIDEDYMKHLVMSYDNWANKYRKDILILDWNNPISVKEVAKEFL